MLAKVCKRSFFSQSAFWSHVILAYWPLFMTFFFSFRAHCRKKLISCRYKSKSLPRAESPHSPSLLPFFRRLLLLFFVLHSLHSVLFGFFFYQSRCHSREFFSSSSSSSFLFQSRLSCEFHQFFMLFYDFGFIFSSHECKTVSLLIGCALDFSSFVKKTDKKL